MSIIHTHCLHFLHPSTNDEMCVIDTHSKKEKKHNKQINFKSLWLYNSSETGLFVMDGFAVSLSIFSSSNKSLPISHAKIKLRLLNVMPNIVTSYTRHNRNNNYQFHNAYYNLVLWPHKQHVRNDRVFYLHIKKRHSSYLAILIKNLKVMRPWTITNPALVKRC